MIIKTFIKKTLKQQMFKCETQCVKVSSLRKKYGKEATLETWCANEDNVLCCRSGRVFIKQADGTNKVFAYPKSKWCNPYKVGKDGTLEEVCALFEEHVLTSDLKDDLPELVGKTLGCFCVQSGPCHTQILQRLVSGYDEDEIKVDVKKILKAVPHPEDKCSAITKAGTKCKNKHLVDGLYCQKHIDYEESE